MTTSVARAFERGKNAVSLLGCAPAVKRVAATENDGEKMPRRLLGCAPAVKRIAATENDGENAAASLRAHSSCKAHCRNKKMTTSVAVHMNREKMPPFS